MMLKAINPLPPYTLTVVGRDVPQGQSFSPKSGGDMDSENGLCLPEGPLLAHAPPPRPPFLRGLEQQPHRARQRGLLRLREGGTRSCRVQAVKEGMKSGVDNTRAYI